MQAIAHSPATSIGSPPGGHDSVAEFHHGPSICSSVLHMTFELKRLRRMRQTKRKPDHYKLGRFWQRLHSKERRKEWLRCKERWFGCVQKFEEIVEVRLQKFMENQNKKFNGGFINFDEDIAIMNATMRCPDLEAMSEALSTEVA